jgi:hypothetical protein
MDTGRFVNLFYTYRTIKYKHVSQGKFDSDSSGYKNQASLMDYYVHVNMCVCLSFIHNCLTQLISLHAIWCWHGHNSPEADTRYYLY